MSKVLTLFLFVLLVSSYNSWAEDIPISAELIARLRQTKLINREEVVESLKIPKKGLNRQPGFVLTNPYEPALVKHLSESDRPVNIKGMLNYKELVGGKVKFFQQDVVHQWFNVKPIEERKSEVCGVKFVDPERYVLHSFASKDDALKNGYLVTHQYHCGACSSLKDLAVYLDNRNLTAPARICSKKLSLDKSKKCYMEEIGFSETCAESWAYDSQNTRKACLGICVKDYGLLNLILNRFTTETTEPDGTLKPCIRCDELRSVPGYMYSAGRTRRGSGIIAEIERDPNEIYHIDYRTYYDLFDLPMP